ncbi:MAG TPA: tetratricopeptide repeat protein [Chthoniobacterales bacterium]|nr:tetratricopeptide repeat protein [Chthoniobacterales bacterium]
MKRTVAIFAWIFLFAGLVRAELPELETAVRPMDEGVPQVAVMRLRTLLEGELAEEDRRAANAKLGEALLAAGETEEALKVLEDPALQILPATRFCRAQALAALERWTEALPLYRQVAAESASPFRSRAILGQAESLRALGRSDEALRVFALLFSDPQWKDRAELRSVELLLEKRDTAAARRILERTRPALLADKKEKRFFQGRLEAQLNHRERALELFQTILRRPEGASRAVLIATLCGVAEVNLRLKTPETGDDPLEDFVEHHPTDPGLPTIFQKLDQLYRAQRTPSNQELRRWAADPIQPRRSLAQWYLARSELRAGRRENALKVFGELRDARLQLPALAEGLLEFAQLELENRRFDEALAILEDAQALRAGPAVADRINFLIGRTRYGARQFEAAAQTFERVAHTSPRAAADSFFNASLAWLQLSDHARFQADFQELGQAGGNDEARGDLSLEEGLIQAAQGNKKAKETLQAFLQAFPQHPRLSEAWVALAELAFHSVPANLEAARKNLASAREAEPNAAANERADYLIIWIEDATPNAEAARVIEVANHFLQKYPGSPLVSDVRMKLAETYYRQQDFPNAQTQFQILAQENPRAGFAEKALFFAAKAAMQSMGAQSLDRALVLLDEVVKKNGELKWPARIEQAVIERKLGKPQDAATLYDEVLQGAAKPEEKREALCGKGDILYEAGPADRASYPRAIEIYDQLASQADAPLHWRNQALFKKGICLEKLDDRANALATFYKIIEDESRPDREREFFWYYKAGFNAARLLEEDSKWQPAAIVYQKLASAGGARSDEAKSRLSRLRLEHFLWEQ